MIILTGGSKILVFVCKGSDLLEALMYIYDINMDGADCTK